MFWIEKSILPVRKLHPWFWLNIVIVTLWLSTTSLLAASPLKPHEVIGQWGFINQSGEVAINYQFERVGNFIDGLAPVRVKGKEGYIDTIGKIIITPQYAWASDFSEKIARVNIGGTWDGRTVKGGKWGFIDKNGKLFIEAQFEEAKDFAEGMAAIKLEGKWGYVDKKGKIVIKPRYTGAWNFSQSLALVRGSKYIYINPLGKTIIEPQKVEDWSDVPGHFSQDFARVKLREKWGYIDRRGNLVIAPEFDAASEFVENLALVQIADKWGYINKSGTFTIKPQYEWADRFYGDRAVVKVNGQYGFINRSGELVIPAQYSEVAHFSEGLAAVKTIDGWGFIDPMGNIVIKPVSSAALSFSGGLAAMRLGPGWGYVNDKKQFVIPPKFEWAGEFSESLAFVAVNGKYGIIDPAAVWNVLPTYAGYSSFKNGTALVSTEFMNPRGNVYIDPKGNIVKEFASFIETNCRATEHLLKGGFLSVLEADGLKVYREPSLASEELGVLPYNTQIQIIEYTFEPIELKGIKGHWVAIDFKGVKGFIFDGFLARLQAPKTGAHYMSIFEPFLAKPVETIVWYSPKQLMRTQEGLSGIVRAMSGRAEAGATRVDYYIPGLTIREVFLLVRSMPATVYKVNDQKVPEGTQLKDIAYAESNGRISLVIDSEYSEYGAYEIIIEKEKLGYIHIYELFTE